jgi:hypothetical protein
LEPSIWQPDREGRALARLTFDRDVTSYHARKLARKGKAEPAAAEAMRGRGIGLSKLLEQFTK